MGRPVPLFGSGVGNHRPCADCGQGCRDCRIAATGPAPLEALGAPAFPKASGGKTPSQIVSTLSIVEQRDMDDILAKVREVFHEAFGVEARMITIETTPNEVPGWDSVGHLDLASRLEGAFGVTFEVDDLMEMESVRDIVRLVNAKL